MRGVGFRVQKVKNPLQRRHGPLHDRIFRGQVADWGEKFLYILDEGHERTEGEGSADDLAPSVPDDKADCDGGDGLHRGIEGGIPGDDRQVGVPVGGVEAGEFLLFRRLPVEEQVAALAESFSTLSADSFRSKADNQVNACENKLRAVVGRDPFSDALRRVSVMAPEKVHSVKLSFSGKQLEVSTTSPDLGEARDLLAVEFDGAPVKIGFNGRYLSDAIGGISEENLVIEMKDDVSQVVIRPEKDETFRAIIMPMRIL